MKQFLFFIFMLSSLVTIAQTITLLDGKSFEVQPYFRIKDTLFFKRPDSMQVYEIPLADMVSSPSNLKTYDHQKPELYIMKFRQQYLAGIWVAIGGVAIAAIGVAASDNSAPAYIGGVISLVGFGISVNSFSHLKRYYITSAAIPFRE